MLELKRDDRGLLEGIDYNFTEDGYVDWRSMIEPEFIAPNKRNFESRGENIPESIDGLEDKDLVILLQGFRRLARLRGFLHIDSKIAVSTPELAAVECRITWLPNFETQGANMLTTGNADAHRFNTSEFGSQFLTAIAENRAFVRCVRNFLDIPIVGETEIGSQGSAAEQEEGQAMDAPPSPQKNLEAKMKECEVDFDAIKKKLIKDKEPGAEEYNSPQDIPGGLCFKIIGGLNRKAQAKKAKAKKAS